MIQRGTCVTVADNSGVVLTRVIELYNGRRRVVGLGDVIKTAVCRIKRLRPWGKARLGRTRKIIFKKRRKMGWIVRTKYATPYFDGTRLYLYENSIIVVRVLRGIKLYRGRKFFGAISRKFPYEKQIEMFGMCL